ncbi:succinate dehydrogenase, hydrophobic membrane anchor protein [Chitinimonas sp. BJB300]|uniref:succinate dehydrogenase, hydrophobic membrane anchor protein n=1 Tax=Chitinimonas sp. BJB300 TaxID=1559339 RepID=UPI000C108988|nr:succinate dehydrogenase, hydrophobic membrane anchor protein [Chitinimonas sp. BJB300]PHV13273.1 succinate dehydrogenase, hydrophobic membrane anchor protein [Chitinimonas sp. BJB300]TSJ86023.1 succinate dehydrogenase, hydrophobic membrane anchor protein [Chitinimonas sp. BJB300]
MVNRHVIGAHYGLRDWLLQRITAVVMLVYTIGLVTFLVLAAQATYEGWQTLFSLTWVRVLSTVTVIALLLHAWVGIRDIWMDYVQPLGLRLSLHVATILWLVGNFVYAVKVVWGV